MGKPDKVPVRNDNRPQAKAGKRKLYKTHPTTPRVHHLHGIGWWRKNQPHIIHGLIDGIEPICPGCDGVHLAVG